MSCSYLETRVRAWATPFGVCGEPIRTGTRFPPSISVFPMPNTHYVTVNTVYCMTQWVQMPADSVTNPPSD